MYTEKKKQYSKWDKMFTLDQSKEVDFMYFFIVAGIL